jgi:hypothetical protein
VPVSGLAATDFTIHATIVGAGGSFVEIASAGGGQHGDYLLDVVPVTYQGTQYTWAYGRYIFVLAVARGADQVNIQVLGPGVAASNRGLRSSVGPGVAVVGERGFRDDCGL